MLIKCSNGVLVPLTSIDKCVDKGDCIVVYVDDETHFARGEDAEFIRSLVAHKATQEQPKAAKEQAHGKQEGIASIPVFPQGGKRNVASR